MITTTQARTSIKNVVGESFLLNPSALITLFEIDVSELGLQTDVLSETEVQLEKNTVFRFHNNINLTTNSLFWRGNEYMAAPIQAVDFEVNVKGDIPIPKLSMTVSDENIPLMSVFKQKLLEIGDIAGAKVTRIRTYSRFVDAVNFLNSVPPKDFYPDPNAELPRDIYYIDRKSAENKNYIEYELAPAFETDGILLPGRIISENNCIFNYRGEGCLYEFNSRRDAIHGDGNLPTDAPPVANLLNERISLLITGAPFTDRGKYNFGGVYNIGDYVYIYSRGIKYYFVSTVNNNLVSPPNTSYWVADNCSKKILGCKLRWQNIGSGTLPFGGFPAVNRFQ